MVAGPIWRVSWVKLTPSALSRSTSLGTSSTAKDAHGIPSALSASLYGPTAGWLSGSRSSSTPSRSCGETTVNHRVHGRTEVFGDIAQHFGSYAKAGVQDGTPFTGRGMKTLQFVRTPDGWRISAAAWDDERDGLTIDTDWLTSPQATP